MLNMTLRVPGVLVPAEPLSNEPVAEGVWETRNSENGVMPLALEMGMVMTAALMKTLNTGNKEDPQEWKSK